MVNQWRACTNSQQFGATLYELGLLEASREGHCLTDVNQPTPKESNRSAECFLGRQKFFRVVNCQVKHYLYRNPIQGGGVSNDWWCLWNAFAVCRAISADVTLAEDSPGREPRPGDQLSAADPLTSTGTFFGFCVDTSALLTPRRSSKCVLTALQRYEFNDNKRHASRLLPAPILPSFQ